jgi:hypothetical protein
MLYICYIYVQVSILPGLEDHSEKNKAVLELLASENVCFITSLYLSLQIYCSYMYLCIYLQISHRYTRWSFEERFQNRITSDMAKQWNTEMAAFQKVRLQPSDEVGLSLDGDDVAATGFDEPVVE